MARPKGVLNSKTLEAIGIINDKKCNPLGILCDIAMGVKLKCGVTLEGISTEVEQIASLDQRKDAAKELCQYIYPKRKAIEHTGRDGDEMEFKDVTKSDAEILAQYYKQPKGSV